MLKTNLNIATLDLKSSQDDLKFLQAHLASLKAGMAQTSAPDHHNGPTREASLDGK